MKSALVLCLCAASALAQSSQQRGKEIVNEALAALGGPKFLGMRNRVESGRAYSFYHERLSGLAVATFYTRYLKPSDPPVPGELLQDERQSFGREEKYGATLFVGGTGYQITFRGARPIPTETNQRYVDTTLHNIFYILRERLNEPGMIFEERGTDIVDNQPVNLVAITDPANRVVTVYFHRTTKLPVRQLYYRRDPKTRERNEEVTIFSKYRDVGGGVMWPFAIQRVRNDEPIFQIYSESVEINKDLPDRLFALPPGIKMLKPMN
jgi:hypothetical protein